MSDVHDSDHDGARCGCCTGLDALERRTVSPSPGLDRLPRRIGTHQSFLARLLAGLTRHDATRPLTSRADDDTAIAMLDAWAVVADSLTFYTEQIANEHYVRTAAERRSVGELGRLIGRTLRPGLAAELDLAFMMDSTPGAPASLLLEPGTGVQSDPEPGNDPAVFETVEQLEVRPSWNRLRARAGVRQIMTGSTRTVYLDGTATKLRRGDAIAFRAPNGVVQFGLVSQITTVDGVPPKPDDPGRLGCTIVRFENTELWTDSGLPGSFAVGSAPAPGPLTGAAGWLAGEVYTAAELAARAAERRIELAEIEASLAGVEDQPGAIVAFRTTAALFGAQAPDSNSLATALKQELKALPNPPDAAFSTKVDSVVSGTLFPWGTGTAANMPGGSSTSIRLDNGYPTIAGGNIVMLLCDGISAPYMVGSAAIEGFASAGVSGKSTRLTLLNNAMRHLFAIRRTAVHGEPEQLRLALEPITASVTQNTIELEGFALGLLPGRLVAVSGRTASDPGTTVVHVTTLAEVIHDFTSARRTSLTLAESLPADLDPLTVTINANVLRGSHGHTRHDVLGSGDSRRVFQTFRLSQAPLTYLSAPTSAGRVSTLRIYVDELMWREIDHLLSAGPNDRVYVVREDESGTIVQFGDGIIGARLPTGSANIRSVYRAGAGSAGHLSAGRATILMSRPAGLRAATNPRRSRGGAEAETADQARSSIAVGVRTLGRVVSLQDYEDFARAFPGVAKAQATWARVGSRRGVIVTVAGANGASLDQGDPVHDSLRKAFAASGDELIPVHLVSFVPRWFRVRLDLKLDPERVAAAVRSALDARVHAQFGFDGRQLGQDVAASEILAVVQSTVGVIAADLTLLSFVVDENVSTTVPDRLDATAPAAGVLVSPTASNSSVPRAQLLTIEPRPIVFGDLP